MLKKEKIMNIFEKKRVEITNTEEFKIALEKGRLKEAEKFLLTAQKNPNEYQPQLGIDVHEWIDHRQRELFQAFYRQEDWQGAKRIIEATEKDISKKGRIARIEELSGMNYEDI